MAPLFLLEIYSQLLHSLCLVHWYVTGTSTYSVYFLRLSTLMFITTSLNVFFCNSNVNTYFTVIRNVTSKEIWCVGDS